MTDLPIAPDPYDLILQADDYGSTDAARAERRDDHAPAVFEPAADSRRRMAPELPSAADAATRPDAAPGAGVGVPSHRSTPADLPVGVPVRPTTQPPGAVA
jgi:hypothetical protein